MFRVYQQVLTSSASRSIRASFSTQVRRRRQVSSRFSQSNQDEESAKRTVSQVNAMIGQRPMPAAGSGIFVAKDKHGNELPMDEYLKFASLSPWVPAPDPVALRALDIAKASSEDIHYELGSGDGRMNFHAIGSTYNVKKSVGIDIDASLIEQSNLRKARIHPSPEHLEFICADLLEVRNPQTAELWNKIQKECTVLTMYFVEDALLKIKPLLEQRLVGSKCKVVTIGYAMKGWEPIWAEVILGLTVHLYDMHNLDELYNRSENFDAMSMEADEELNLMSKLKLKEMEDSENGDNNPFRENLPEPSSLDLEDDDDFDLDFDETIEYDDEGNMITK